MKIPDFLIIKNRSDADFKQGKLKEHYFPLIACTLLMFFLLFEAEGFWYYAGILSEIAAVITIAMLTYLKVQLARWYQQNPAE